MGKFSTGYTLGLTKQQFLAAQYLFEGKSARETARYVFDCRLDGDEGKEDPRKVDKYATMIRKWMKDPRFIEGYRSLMKELAYSVVGLSINRLAKQVQDENGWLSNKAANDILNRLYASVMGEDDREIHVKVEGMPALGEPDADDTV